MSIHLVLTATGRDKPGVVDAVTERLVAHDANIEMSRMARLGGEFAMLALVSVEDVQEAGLLAELAELEKEGLTGHARRTDPADSAMYEGYGVFDVCVSGADHPGIIQSVAHDLAKRGINIETMDTEVSAAPLSGAPLFTMTALVVAPPGTNIPDLQGSLADLGQDLSVDIEVKSHEGI